MDDNIDNDLYHYIVAVETGYRMYAGTDSKIFISLYGTEAEEVARELSSTRIEKNSSVFCWGTTARFLLKTPWSLGDIRYVRIWVDSGGRGHRESWFCNRVLVKDLHSGSIYRFPIHDWLGQSMGDGASERLSAVEENYSLLNESMSIHILAETISYIAMFTGGGLRTRLRISRCSHGLSIMVAFYVLCLVNWAICALENHFGIYSFQHATFGYSYSIRDIGWALLLAFIILPFTSVMAYIKSYIPAYDELIEMEFIERRGLKANLPYAWPYALREIMQLVLTWLIVCFFIVDVSLASSLAEDGSISYTKRYFLALFIWILFAEPLKGFVCAYYILKKDPDHAISCDFDEAILPLDYGKTLDPAPARMMNTIVGTTESDAMQLQDNEEKKTREELFFYTMGNVTSLLATLVVIMGLVYYHRDRHGFYYQQQVRSLLNLDQIPFSNLAFGSINRIDHFWLWSQQSLAPASALLASWYDGSPAWSMRGFANDKVSRAMGIGHIRQLRSLSKPNCNTVPQLDQYFHNCSSDITLDTEDRTPQYAAGWQPYFETPGKEARSEYKYSTSDELQSITVEGQLHSYSGGGYSVLLKGSPSQIKGTLEQLQKENWIDLNTRAVFVELSMYNAQVNYFAIVQLVLEIPAEGYLLPSSWVETVRLIRYQGEDGDTIMTFELLYLAFAVYSFLKNTYYYVKNVVEAFKSNSKKGNPFKRLLLALLGRFWDFVDLFVGILGILSVISYFLRVFYINQALENFEDNNGNSYINLSLQRNVELMFTFCVAGVVFFTSCKMIKILRFNRRISILADTLNYAGVSMTDFAVVFAIIVCAFNVSLYCLLWNKLESYRSVVATVETTIAGMLGKFVVADMFQITMLASIIFMIFMYCGTLFLINIFVMIVLYEFEQVRNDSSRQTNEYEIIEHVQTKILRSIGMYGREDVPACYVEDTVRDFELLKKLDAQVDVLLHRVQRWQHMDEDEFIIPPPRMQDIPKLAEY